MFDPSSNHKNKYNEIQIVIIIFSKRSEKWKGKICKHKYFDSNYSEISNQTIAYFENIINQ